MLRTKSLAFRGGKPEIRKRLLFSSEKRKRERQDTYSYKM